MDAPARRAKVEVEWRGVAITSSIAPYLLGLSYTDNLSGAADDLSIEVEDRDGLWSGDWRPTFGDSAEAWIEADPWVSGVSKLRLGVFAHDKISFTGPPRKATIKCVSAPLSTGLRRHKRTRAWSSVTLRQIAQDIADRAGLSLAWDGDTGKTYRRREQKNKSDLEFLEEACKEVGRNLKVTENQIAVFDALTRDSATSIGSISLSGGWVKNWTFDGDDSGRYGSCVITFFDPRSGKVKKGQFPRDGRPVAGLDPDGQTLEINMAIDSIGDATDRARSLLRNANRFATSGRLVTVGDPGLVAGVTFDLTDAQAFNGKFIIEKAEHKPVGGYTATLDVRRCLEY